MQGNVYIKSAETALLLGKLKHEGVSVGMRKLSNEQYNDLFEFVREEYPNMPYVGTELETMTRCYALYDTTKSGRVKELQSLIAQDSVNSENRHMIFVAAENNRPDQFLELLNSFDKELMNEADLKLIESIKVEALELAIKSSSTDILQLYTDSQVQINYNAETVWNLLKKVEDPSSFRETDKQIVEYIFSNFKGDKQEIWKLACALRKNASAARAYLCLP